MLDQLTIRVADRGDAASLAELFQQVYRNSSHPFQSIRDIERFFDEPRNVGIAGEIGNRVIAFFAMAFNPWNDSYELGRGLTDPAWRAHGIAALLVQRVIGEVRERQSGDVFVAYCRAHRIVELGEVLNPPMVAVGHDAGQNVANGIREMHVILYGVPSYATFVHVQPPESVRQSSFVRHDVYRALALKGVAGGYPPATFVGAPTSRAFKIADFVVAYDPASAHRGLEILDHRTAAEDPVEICADLDRLFAALPDIRHVAATVLADKIDALRALRAYGFEVVAYRPAWYRSGDCRYDCVDVAKRLYGGRPFAQGFDQTLGRLVSGLESIVPFDTTLSAPVGARGSKRSDIMAFREPAPAAIVPAPRPVEPVWRPVLFRLALEDDRFALGDRLARHGAGVRVYDTLEMQLRDLIKTRHPALKLSAADLDSMVADHLDRRPPEEYGVWAYYPWSGALVHLLDEAEFGELRTNRNRYKITPAEQATLATKRVGVVGLSVGQSVSLTMALERSFGELRLADFDTIDLSNLNRLRAGVHEIGVPKVYVTAREISEIDPYLDVKVFSDGITPANIDIFLLHGGPLDVVVEECDSIDIKVVVRHEARRHRIPVVMDTSDRGMLDIERFDLEPGRPIFHGLAADLNPELLRGLTTEEKVPYVLRILDGDTVSDRLRASMLEIDQTISTWPQLGADVTHGGAAAAHAVRHILLGTSHGSGRFLLDLDDSGADHLVARAARPRSRDSIGRTSGPDSASRVTDPLIRRLVSDAVLAPSGGNTQPWRWIAEASRLHLYLDRTRTAGLIDVDAGGSFVALGCAAENFVLAAHAAGRSLRVETFPDPARSDHAATFTLLEAHDSSAEPHWRDDLHEQIARRHTNRTMGQRVPLADRDREALTDAIRSVASADIQWLTTDDELARVGNLVGAADRLRMLHPRCHREMFDELRWTREEAEATRDGIDVAALALSPTDLAGLELCRHASSLDLVREWGGGKNLEKMSRKYVAAASAVGLITMRGARSTDYFNGGRALQRMWLEATARGIAVHPMTTLPYFFALVNRGDASELDPRTISELRAMRVTYSRLFAISDSTGEVLLFRVGHANETELRSLRRPLDDVLRS